MRIRRFAVIATRSLLSMLIFSLIFISLTEFNTEDILDSLFGDIYKFSDRQKKETTIERLDIISTTLIEQKQNLQELRVLCNDPEKLNQIEENCNKYYALLEKDQIKRDPDLEKLCLTSRSEDIEARCSELKGQPDLNISNIEKLQDKKESGQIDNKEFFKKFMMSVSQLPTDQDTDLKKFIIPLAIAVLVLASVLFILQKENIKALLFSIGRITFNLGLFFIIIFSVFYIYYNYTSPDTSFILNSISDTFQQQQIIQKSLPILIPLVLGQFFDITLFITGLALLTLGITLKIIFRKTGSGLVSTNI